MYELAYVKEKDYNKLVDAHRVSTRAGIEDRKYIAILENMIGDDLIRELVKCIDESGINEVLHATAIINSKFKDGKHRKHSIVIDDIIDEYYEYLHSSNLE